jgi:hypothetical protein
MAQNINLSMTNPTVNTPNGPVTATKTITGATDVQTARQLTQAEREAALSYIRSQNK